MSVFMDLVEIMLHVECSCDNTMCLTYGFQLLFAETFNYCSVTPSVLPCHKLSGLSPFIFASITSDITYCHPRMKNMPCYDNG